MQEIFNETLKSVLKEVAVPLQEVDFTRENYNKLFPRNRIQTPIESVKMGENQFEKMDAKERRKLMLAAHVTLTSPDIVVSEMRETVFGDERPAHLYAKSFVIGEKEKAVQSVVVAIDGENVSISSHERDINNIVNKIKEPDQLLYAAAKVRLLVEQHTGEKLPQSVVNHIREVEYVASPNVNISQTPQKSNDNKEKLLSDLETKASLELFSRLAAVLDEGTVYTARNKTLGEIQFRHGNKSTGLEHIINRRYEERVLNKAVQMQPEDAQKEITAICFLVADSLDKGAASQTPRGNREIEKGGIKAIINKDREGKFVITGFDDKKNKAEATESIKAGIAKYGYTPEFLDMYAQVGAVIASYEHSTPQNQQKSNENSGQNLLEGCVKIEVNGKERECKNGVLEGFKNAVKLVDRLMDVNHQLADENEKLRNQIHNQNKNKRTDIER